MRNLDSFSELEEDWLKELFNLGIGSAALSLNQMMKQEVSLSAPRISFTLISQFLDMFSDDENIVSITQQIRGPFSTNSILLFKETHSQKIAELLLKQKLTEESMSVLEEEVLSEVGGVVLKSCIDAIAQSIDASFNIGIPMYQKSKTHELLKSNNLLPNDIILTLHLSLTLKESDITTYIAFVFTPEALHDFFVHQQQFLNTIDMSK